MRIYKLYCNNRLLAMFTSKQRADAYMLMRSHVVGMKVSDSIYLIVPIEVDPKDWMTLHDAYPLQPNG